MTSVQLSDGNPDGNTFGQSRSDLIAFYGTTPVSQRASAVQQTYDTVASSASFGATHASALNSIIATLNELHATLKGLGIWKGSA